MPGGIPRYIRIYDNGGETFDRYTCLFTGRAGTYRTPDGERWGQYRGMSADPCHPQGFGQWGEIKGGHNDTDRWGYPPTLGRSCHLGKRIPFAELPEPCQRLVVSDYMDLWSIHP